MSGDEELLVRLARAIAAIPMSSDLSARLCLACRDLAGADGAALTLSTPGHDGLTLFSTDDVSARLEDLQQVTGQGPGPTAARSGTVEVYAVGRAHDQWPQFAAAAREVVGEAIVHAVPIRHGTRSFGVLSLYQFRQGAPPLAMATDTLLRLAAATGSALVRDPEAVSMTTTEGSWSSQTQIYQATGMVVAQLGLVPDDALAVLKAHAYAGDVTLADVAVRVLTRTLRFTPPTE